MQSPPRDALACVPMLLLVAATLSQLGWPRRGKYAAATAACILGSIVWTYALYRVRGRIWAVTDRGKEGQP